MLHRITTFNDDYPLNILEQATLFMFYAFENHVTLDQAYQIALSEQREFLKDRANFYGKKEATIIKKATKQLTDDSRAKILQEYSLEPKALIGIFDKPVTHDFLSKIKFSIGLTNLLKDNGYNTIGQLVQAHPDDLKKIPTVKFGKITQIKDMLRENGLKLGMTQADIDNYNHITAIQYNQEYNAQQMKIAQQIKRTVAHQTPKDKDRLWYAQNDLSKWQKKVQSQKCNINHYTKHYNKVMEQHLPLAV